MLGSRREGESPGQKMDSKVSKAEKKKVLEDDMDIMHERKEEESSRKQEKNGQNEKLETKKNENEGKTLKKKFIGKKTSGLKKG